MNFQCTLCGLCCRTLNAFVSPQDIDRWIEDNRMDLISALVWQIIPGRNPPALLMIPRKKHIKTHKMLAKYHRPEHDGNGACIYLNKENKCTIHSERPEACRTFPLGKLDFPTPGLEKGTITEEDKNQAKELATKRTESNQTIYANREFYSQIILQARMHEKSTLGALI